MAIRNSRSYSDLDMFFTKHPITLDVNKKTNSEAVKASIRNIINTKHYERLFHPEFGCQVHSLLFENFTPSTKEIIKKTISESILYLEPRAQVVSVDVSESSEENGINITVHFKLINSERPLTVTTFLTRVR